MLTEGTAGLMRIYTDERARAEGAQLVTKIVERARAFPIAGATVLRAVVGFGETGRVQRASILDLSGNLPLVVELVDSIDSLRAFLPTLEGMEDIGLVTLEEVEILHYGKKAVAFRHPRTEAGSHDPSANCTAPQDRARKMDLFRVEHKHSGQSYFVHAEDSVKAVERVTLQLGDTEGLAAWTASPSSASFAMNEGEIRDDEGKLVDLSSA